MRWGGRVSLGSQRWVGQSGITVANYILALLMVGGKSISKEKMTVCCSLLPSSVWFDFSLDLYASEICHPVQVSVELFEKVECPVDGVSLAVAGLARFWVPHSCNRRGGITRTRRVSRSS